MGDNRTNSAVNAIILIATAIGVAWLATKIARTPEGTYRLLVIGAAVAFVTLLIAIPAGIKRMRGRTR